MADNNQRSKLEATKSEFTRRAFTQSAAGAVALAAIGPTTAKEGVSNTNATNASPIEDSFTPTGWDVVGPFQYQRRGVETGWLYPNRSELAFATGEQTPDGGQRFQSAFAGGATVTWDRVGLDKGETSIPLDFGDRIDPTGGDLTPLTGESGAFDDFQDWFGAGGVLYSAGYAVASFDIPETRRAVLETDASVAWLNGKRYEEPPQGVVLESGTNFLLLKTTVTFGSGSASIRFRSPRAPVEVNELASFRGTPQNVILPDLREGKRTDRPASVRVTNTTGEEQSPTLQFAPDSDLLKAQTVTVDSPLAPFETRRIETQVATKGKVPIQDASLASVEQETVPGLAMTSTETADLTSSDRIRKTGGGEFTVEAASAGTTALVSVGEERDERAIPLRIRRTNEARWQTTFVSKHDESVQTMGIKEPTNPDADGPFELIVSLHGANVPAINQAGANVQRDGAYVVAPSARGPVNYDHEDLGRLDDLEAMSVMKDRFDIDETGIYLTGHSMGGHGTWHVGLTNPDRFAGLAPSAGWTDHETYLTVPFEHDKLHTFPRLKTVAESSLQKNLALPKTENAVDGTLPIFALHGGKDTSVPSLHPRTYLRTLANRGLSVKGEVGKRYSTPEPTEVDVAYLEVPGQPHWWDAGIGEGNDSVNHPDLRTFLRSTTRDPYPAHVHLFTTNLRIEHQKYWVAVLEQETIHAPTRVDAEISSDGLRIATENVTVLSIDPRVFREANVRVRGKPTATVNGERVKMHGKGGRKRIIVDLENGPSASRDGRWRRGRQNALRKSQDQYGPLKEIHHNPYRLVYGTKGSDAETDVNRNLANIRSQRLVERARAPATVIPDSTVDRSVMSEYNLVLFGRPSSNSVYRQLEDGFPMDVRDGHASIGGHDYSGDLGIEFVYPNPKHHDKLVQVETGTSIAGIQLTRVRNWIPTQKATPDYAVFDDSIRFQSWNACRAAGFFDKRWEVAPELGYLRSTSSVGVGHGDDQRDVGGGGR
ncbi:prolyl oligopeptidase family serine peptidase [Haladaptatus sp. DYF46]|uniref:carboxylesterase family protein n=1 Tax=Haladaptatus sp. DYF46 TaxID=2886041 RepID=UPI001E518AC1|nr:prolyl oligopeptidase family serine peptidase [Haladaptatus sp. DYF46]